MRLPIIAGISLSVVVACSGKPARSVRQADLDAWSGAPLIELATHPVFSHWQHQIQKLPDGRERWTMTKCEQSSVIGIMRPGFRQMQAPPFTAPMPPPHIEPAPFTPAPYMPFPFMGSGAASTSRICCHAQFTVRGPYVESYRAVGDCFTDCRHRPHSRPCDGAAGIATAPPPPPDPMLAEIRKMPRSPALGANNAQVTVTCEQQHGWLSERDDTATCRVGADAIFVCRHDAHQIVQCDTFFEGGDLAAFQTAAENRFGPPADVHVSDAGLRFVGWPSAGYALTTYPKGVQVTVARVPR